MKKKKMKTPFKMLHADSQLTITTQDITLINDFSTNINVQSSQQTKLVSLEETIAKLRLNLTEVS